MKIYKKRWEEQCANSPEEDEPEDPASLVYKTKRLCTDEHHYYEFKLDEDDELIVSVSADDYIDVSICTPADYKRWRDAGDDLRQYDSAEDVRECELSFVAPRSKTYFLLLINDGDEDVEVTVDVTVWEGQTDEE